MALTNRRKFIQQALFASGGLLLAPNFISCSDDDNELEDKKIDFSNFKTEKFNYGVASFDPTNSSVIIWTRYENPASVFWEVATDKDFTTTIRSGSIETNEDRDNTIAIELTELEADQKLYYRFYNEEDNSISAIGETITLPTNANSIKMAVSSCSNYQAGLFNVYDAIAKSEADIIIHLGDYIYEYEAGGYGATEENKSLGRDHKPSREIISLDDYRTRYKQYRSDKSLQLAHQKKPFICVWDDHEVTNDTYKDGAENHDPSEGSFEERKQAALKAYSEFLPFSRIDVNNNALIYRTINIGNLVNLIMLDTRVIGRDKQLNIQDYFSVNGFDFGKYQSELFDTSRTLLGTTQRDWLVNELNNNSAKWQVLGQQVLMGKMNVPAEVITSFGAPNFGTVLSDLVTIKGRALAGDPTLTQEELQRIGFAIPYNLDAWDGYPVERETIYAALNGKKIITLAGDTHNAWSSDLVDQSKNKVGIELASSSVSSPGFEGFLGNDPQVVGGFEFSLETLIDDLNYFNASKRGFMEITFTQNEVTSDWIFVDTILSEAYITEIGKTITYS